MTVPQTPSSSLREPEWARLRLGLPSLQRLYDLVRQGVVPAVHLGRRLAFDEDVIESFVRSGGRRLPGGWRREPEEPRPAA